MTQNNVIQFRPRKTESESGFTENPPTTAATNTSETAVNNQSSDSGFNIEKFLPEGRSVHFSEEGFGFHHIPHKIFEFMVKATDSRVETAVFACLIRYTLGFHRSTCKASHTFIAEWVGFSPTSVRRGVDGLLKKKLILSQGAGSSWNESTTYEVPVIKAYLASLKNLAPITDHSKTNSSQKSEENPPKSNAQKSPEPQENGCQQVAGVCRESAQYSADSRQSTVPAGGTKKENSNKDLNKTLSPEKQKESDLENNQDPINAYFQSLFSKPKRISEIKHFDSFKYFYKRQDLDYVLTYLLTKGVPGTGQPVHSPMAFLSKSITNVMPLILAERDRIQKRLQREKEEAEQKQREVQEEEENEKRFVAAIGMFHKAFPTLELQQEVIQDFANRYPLLPKDGFTLRNSAIQEWASKQRHSSTTTTSNS